jgi:hypothetical protein
VRVEWIFVSASLLVSLAVAEGVLRFFPSFQPQPEVHAGGAESKPHEYLVPDADLGWTLIPNHEFIHETDEFKVVYRSNALGFRDERAAAPAPGERRVAIIGDSFSFGYGVAFEETFGARIDASLAGAAVQNFALPGYGIDQMWLTERKHVLALRPALLIVAFISDDFSRSLTSHRYLMHLNKPAFELDGGALRMQSPERRPPAWRAYLANHSYLWAGVRHLVRLAGHHYPVGRWWDLNRALLDRIRADAEAAEARVLFVYLFTRKPRPFPGLARYMRATSADFVDLGSPPRMLTFPGDGHPNAEGHRYIADGILEWIRREMPELAAPAAGRATASGDDYAP